MDVEKITVIADRGYFSGEEVLACEAIGASPPMPKTYTSGTKADGRFGKQDLVYLREQDVYRCPAGQLLSRHMTTVEGRLTLYRYWDVPNCTACRLKTHCTSAPFRRVARWKHEGVVDATLNRLELAPDAMTIRRRAVEHPFGTLKSWMGATHFLTKGLEKVRTEMSLHVLAYNLRRTSANHVCAPPPPNAVLTLRGRAPRVSRSASELITPRYPWLSRRSGRSIRQAPSVAAPPHGWHSAPRLVQAEGASVDCAPRRSLG